MKTTNIINSKILLGLFLILLSSCKADVKQDVLKNKDLAIAEEIQNKDLPLDKIKKEEKPFLFNISNRFAPIKKSDLGKTISIRHYMSAEESQQATNIESIELIKVIDNKRTNIRAFSQTDAFSKEQFEFFEALDYADNFIIKINYVHHNPRTNKDETYHFGPHYTVVPEYEANFKEGNDALLTYFNSNWDDIYKYVKPEKLRYTKFYFYVNNDGTISNIRKDWSTGYNEIDQKIEILINNSSNLWNSAKNNNEQGVNQELVLTFGIPGGC